MAELRRLRQLEAENRKLKQLVADLTLDKYMVQETAPENCRMPHRRTLADEDGRNYAPRTGRKWSNRSSPRPMSVSQPRSSRP